MKRAGIVTGLMVVCLLALGAGTPEKKTVEIKEADVTAANNAFATDIYKELAKKEGNLFLSPYSLSSALTMTYAGAGGDTRAQMSAVLHLPQDGEKLHRAAGDLLESIGQAPSTGSGQGKQCRLDIANALWGQKGYRFLPHFLSLLKESYDAPLHEVNFIAEPEKARKTINAWAEEKTREKIKDLIPPGIITRLTRLVLTNAVYFKGLWKKPFKEERTREMPFHVSAEEEIQAPMMRQVERLGYAEIEGGQIVELPYAGDRLSMLVVVPEERDGLRQLESGLSSKKLKSWLGRLRQRKTRLYLPRFEMTSSFRLRDPLQALGMKDAFSLSLADFSGMNGEKDLFISAVVHKTYVKVNEEGTEAAAATAVVMTLKSVGPPAEIPVVRADHPFLFIIYHRATGAVLFIGRVVRPGQTESAK